MRVSIHPPRHRHALCRAQLFGGEILCQSAPRHRHQEWLSFLRQLDAHTPPELALHLILDNYATHKPTKVRAWLARHPRFHLHFTPTASSWLNLVERFFADLSADVVREGSFASVPALIAAIEGYLAERNLAPEASSGIRVGKDRAFRRRRGCGFDS